MVDNTELNPFDPTKQGEDSSGLADQWRNYLADPAARATLLAAGTQLMQPVGFGQTPMGHIGMALGQAGESARLSEAMGLKQREAASKEELRGAQADAAGARAGAMGSAANAAETRLKMEEMRQKGLGDRADLNARVRASISYPKYLKYIEDKNLMSGGKEAPMDYPAYLESFRLGELGRLSGQQGATATGVPPPSGGAPRSGAPQPRPKVGEVRGGNRYLGGDPNSQDSWEPE